MATERDAKAQGFKRINFFKGFLTTEHDWNDAERYHLEKRKLHNRLCHAPGMIPGYSGELQGDGARARRLVVRGAAGLRDRRAGQRPRPLGDADQDHRPRGVQAARRRCTWCCASSRSSPTSSPTRRTSSTRATAACSRAARSRSRRRRPTSSRRSSWRASSSRRAPPASATRAIRTIRKANEIDLRWVPRAGVSGSFLDTDDASSASTRCSQAQRRAFFHMARDGKVQTAHDALVGDLVGVRAGTRPTSSTCATCST